MCGRFASTTPPEKLQRLFDTRNPLPNLPIRFNVCPTQQVAAIRSNPQTGERSLDLLTWGLIPHWAKDARIGPGLINARADSLAAKPAFRDAFRRRRCLIPADAFYEWKSGAKPRQPFAVRRKDGQPLVFAGLWENWQQPDGRWRRSCTIVTTSANALLSALHERMPVILDPADWARWLGEQPATPEELQALLVPYPPGQLDLFPVGPEVNDARRDEPGLLDPLAPSEA